MKTKEKNKLSKMKIGSLILTIFFLIYVPSFMNWMYDNQIETEILRYGVIEDVVNVDAFIMRDEEVLKSTFSGKFITEISEGEKVASDSIVATILNDSSIQMLEELKKKDIDILKAKIEKNKNQEIFNDDIIKLESEISQKLKKLISESDNKNMVISKATKNELDLLIQKKASIYGSGSSSDSYILNMEKDKDRLQKQIFANTKKIVSSEPGIVSYVLDGFEEMLKPSNLTNLSSKDIESIKLKDIKRNSNIKTVEVEKSVAKIIKGFEAYLVFVLDKDKAEKYRLDDRIQEVRINHLSRIIDGKLIYKSNYESNKCIVGIKIDKCISETSSLRKINIDIVKNSYKGYKVPLKSLININEEAQTAQIFISKANYANIRNIKVININSEYAIVENLEDVSKPGISLYDSYILKPQNIQEGQMINK